MRRCGAGPPRPGPPAALCPAGSERQSSTCSRAQVGVLLSPPCLSEHPVPVACEPSRGHGTRGDVEDFRAGQAPVCRSL